MISIGPPDALDPAQPAASGPLATAPLEPDPGTQRRRLIWFDDPDGAYLAAAAMRRYLDAMVVSDVVLIPTDQGPALEIPASVAKLPYSGRLSSALAAVSARSSSGAPDSDAGFATGERARERGLQR